MPWSSRAQPVLNCALDDVEIRHPALDPLDPRALLLEVGDPPLDVGGGGGPAVDPHPLAAGELGAVLARLPQVVGELGARGLQPQPRPAAARGHVEAGERHAVDREHREHQEDREQEHRHRRDELGALAMDVAAGQLAGPPGEQRQGPPELAVEMEDAVDEIVGDRADAAADPRLLAALMAIGPVERGAAIEAGSGRLAGMLAGLRLDGARDHPARDRFADAFDP